MVTLYGSDLPLELQRLHEPPKQLHASGQHLPKLMKRPRLGIVGSRKVTAYGRTITTKFASELAGRGVVIISGLALGVDSIAHKAALDTGGTTVAVLPVGLDRIYPTSHHQLAQDIIAQNGLLVTEYPFRTDPRRENFIARNRIIAALSEGLLITEAAVASGSLHTARFALELGIPVLAVPGPITSPTSEGTNNLIKAGAIPVTSAEDIITAMKWQLESPEESDITAATKEERIILELLKQGVSDGHELLVRSGLEAAKFNQSLTMLELTGRIRPLGANHWSL